MGLPKAAETPAAAPQAGADISSTKSSAVEEELQSLVSTLAERISLLESQKNDNNNNDVDPNNRATRRANPNRLLWQKRDAAANDSPYTPNQPAANDPFQETAVKNSKFTFSKGKKSEAQLQQEAEERKQREKHDEQAMID